MKIESVKIKKSRGKFCVIGQMDKPRKVGKMMTTNMMGGCFSSAKDANERKGGMLDGSWKPKGGGKKRKKAKKSRSRR